MAVNPFEVLRLDPASPEDEIVRQAGRLRQRATDEATRNALRQAVQALTARPEERTLHALLAHPQPDYTSPALDQFVAAFRRPPPLTGQPVVCPPLDREEFRRLLLTVVADELEMPALPFEVPATAEESDEIRRQTAEALWQSLLLDTRA